MVNRSLTRKYFQVARETFQHCINQFNYSGINGLDFPDKKRTYSPEFHKTEIP